MHSSPSALHENSLELLSKFLRSDDRCLVLGASGWLGQTTTAMLGALGINFLPTGSNSRTISNPLGETPIIEFEAALVEAYQPTVVFDFAFSTREKLDSIGPDKYIEINRHLLTQGIWASSLDSVRLVIATSSGAAVRPSENYIERFGRDIYSDLKIETEKAYLNLDSAKKLINIIRPWSLSGFLFTKPRGFALTDFAVQSLTLREITISSFFPVYRRYAAVEDLIALSVASASIESSQILDSGGPLVDLFSLAQEIAKQVGSVNIVHSIDPSSAPDLYFSDNLSWEKAKSSFRFVEADLEEQVARVLFRLRTDLSF